MKLIVAIKDVGDTIVQGDLISWHEDNATLGKNEGLRNALQVGSYSAPADYLSTSPFGVLHAPLINMEDIQPIIDEMVYKDENGLVIDDIAAFSETGAEFTSERKWKFNIVPLERRPPENYPVDDQSPTHLYAKQFIDGEIRRDTGRAYFEILRPDITIDQVKVLR